MNKKGQAIIESILILTALLGVSTLTAKFFKDQEVFAQIVTGPWLKIAGMLQNGVWMPPADGMEFHPNARARHVTYESKDKGK
jgi:hypothetical protein